jgi:sugar lactone lactonase YvrE
MRLVGKALLVALTVHAATGAAQTISAYAGVANTAGHNGEGTPATSYQLNTPGGTAVDPSGNLYIADTSNHRLRKVTPGGTISTLLGTGVAGPALTQLSGPTAVAVHAATGDVYVADTGNHRILRLPGGAGPAVLFAGLDPPASGNGGVGIPANTSALNGPRGVAVDAAGNVYISDTENYRIRKVTSGIVSILVGTGAIACSATQLVFPRGIAVGASGELYIADTNGNRVMMYPGTGPSMSIFAGQPNETTCVTGPLVNNLASPVAVAVTQLGDVLITDSLNHVIKRVRGGVMSVVAGTSGSSGTSGDNGSPTAALLFTPRGVAAGPPDSHIYYVSDSNSHRVRKVVPQLPAAPTINSVTTASATSLSVAFTPPALNLDAPATTFTVTCVPGPFFGNGTSSPIVVSGLTTGTSYGCNVAGVNGAGFGATSSLIITAVGVAPAITSGAPPDGAYGVVYSHNYTATGTPSPTFSVTSGALPNGLTLSSGSISGTPIAAGTFNGVVTATNTVAPDATQNFSITIAKASQAITFGTLPDRIIGTGPFGLSATGGASGNPVTFSSLTTGTCTATGANGGTLTLVSTGTCTIAADQAGTANYEAAPQVTQSFAIQAKIAQAISFGALADRLLTAGPDTLSATGGASGNPVTFSSLTPSICTATGTNGTTLTVLAVGTCTIAADQAGNASYEAAPQVTRSFAVQQPGRLVNISTRMQVLTGNDVMIGGFVIGGATNKTVAIVATGPSLVPFGIANPLANPMITLVRQSGQQVIATNDNWQAAANAGQLTAAGFAPSDSLEAAILVNLEPGAYTAIVQGADGGTGVSVIGVYEVDGPSIPLINISTRGLVQTGNNVMIGGFVIDGASPQTVAIVGTGPSLAPFGIANPLANPSLTLVRASDQVVIATNDDWAGDANASLLQAAGFAPPNALESGLYITLQPGAYTAILSGVGNTSGVGVIGVYRVN